MYDAQQEFEIERAIMLRRLDDFIRAKAIKKRRRKLGQNGFSMRGRLAGNLPRHAKYRTRNSQ